MVVTQNQIDHDASPLLSLPSLIQSNRLPILDYVFRSVIGHQHFIEGPYGDVPLIYMDYVASGRSLEFIEDFIIRAILP